MEILQQEVNLTKAEKIEAKVHQGIVNNLEGHYGDLHLDLDTINDKMMEMKI